MYLMAPAGVLAFKATLTVCTCVWCVSVCLLVCVLLCMYERVCA